MVTLENYRVTLTTAPTVEPITAAEVRTWCKLTSITGEHSDTELGRVIASARELVEKRIDRALITQTWTMYLDSFPCWEIQLPKGPWQSITSVKYYDSTTGTLTTLSSGDYLFDAVSGRLTPDTDVSWPSTQRRINAVEIAFVSGYGSTAASTPAMVRECLLEIVADRLKNKSGLYEIPLGTREKLQALWSGHI